MLPFRRRLSRPKSIVRSKATSVASVERMFCRLLSVFSTAQTLCSGTHAEWSCKKSVSRTRKSGRTHQCDTYIKKWALEFSNRLNKWCRDGLTHCGWRMRRWCPMHTSQLPRQFCSCPRWRFCVRMSNRFVEEGLYRENIDYRRTCEGQSKWMQWQMPSRQMSTAGSSANMVIIPRKETAHGFKDNPELCRGIFGQPERRVN
jgi:hypothetical protein